MIDWLKKISFIRFIYRLPGLLPAYYFFLAAAAAVFYRFPSRHITVIGVTGTKGKTSVVEILAAALTASGEPVATCSSLRVVVGDMVTRPPYGNTMPGRFFIQKFLRQAVSAGCRYAVVEVTSQGVAMHRHRFIRWAAGVLTNLSPEHIEWHGSFENYRDAKGVFLKGVWRSGGIIFLNADDSHAGFYTDLLKTVRSDAAPMVYSLQPDISGALAQNPYFESHFNLINAAAAIAVSSYFGIDRSDAYHALVQFAGVSGRFEFVQREPFAVVVDYAHTPDSLRAVYAALRRKQPANRLICVLGSAGGGRDKWKRPQMGAVAGEFCDRIILTNEDPYDENPQTIIDEVRGGIPEGKREDVSILIDRTAAIATAITEAQPGDIVVLTGKGSEQYIHEAAGIKTSWSERGVAEEILKKKKSHG